jgi:archaemetzincin
MKVGILQVGKVKPEVLAALEEGLPKTFPETTCSIIEASLSIPQSAFDKKRNQYNSSIILNEVRFCAAKKQEFHRVLGVVDLDIFKSGLNYVFGSAALISLWRLKTEVYKNKADLALYVLRAFKEAVHELGHTLGVKHCPRSLCVMHFSNSIFDTDKKQNLLCDECYLQSAIAISNLG